MPLCLKLRFNIHIPPTYANANANATTNRKACDAFICPVMNMNVNANAANGSLQTPIDANAKMNAIE